MRRLSIAVGLLAGLGLLGQALAQDTQEIPEVTGKIVKLDRDHQVIHLVRDGKSDEFIEHYSVDEEAVPGWYINHRVGEVVALTLAQQGEAGTRVVAIRHVRDADSE